MSKFNRFLTGLAVLVFSTAILFFLGCEIDSADHKISILPGQSTIYLGQTITLRAEGGYFYTWELEHENWGLLSSRRGDSVTYQSRFTPAASTGEAASIQTVYVYSTYTDQPYDPEGSSTTGTTHYVDSAQATILHMAQ